ncbi:hypothetical protein JZU46_00340 [bacterium]|jgi:hypothetical protein|nr:hypothetical protein [bacterium]
MSDLAPVPTVEQINLEYRRSMDAARAAIALAIKAGLITVVHARTFADNPLALCLQILNAGV